MGNFFSVGAEEHALKMKQLQQACYEKKMVRARQMANITRPTATTTESPPTIGTPVNGTPVNGTPVNDAVTACRTGYNKQGAKCVKKHTITMPIVKRPYVTCPYGFIPSEFKSSMCIADNSTLEINGNEPLRYEGGTPAEVNQWIAEYKTKKPNATCLSKNVGDKTWAICSQTCPIGYINKFKIKQSLSGPILTESDIDVGDVYQYYMACERMSQIDGIASCKANETVYNRYCVENNCPEGYEMEINNNGTSEPQTIGCRGYDSYDYK